MGSTATGVRPRCSIVVIGGGAAGSLTALHLLRRGVPLDVTIVERGARLGAGIAYGTSDDRQLLNVRCGGMSAYLDDPGHFTAWVGRHRAATAAHDFVPRRLYATYLREQLAAAVSPTGRLRVAHAEAVRVELTPSPMVVLADGHRLRADQVVLATGNQPPADPLGLAAAGDRYVADPWDLAWVDRLDPGATVLLAGTGLTAVDIVVTLVERGHHGPIVAVSRHGLLPATHSVAPAPALPPCVDPVDGRPTTARGVLRSLRRAIEDAECRGDDWRQVVDGLRPVSVALWRSLPPAERARFLRHGARRWEVARHRIAPQVGTIVVDALQRGQLRTHRGRITGLVSGPNGIDVSISRGRTTARVEAAVAVDCTGPTADPATGGAVLRDLLARGLARRDPHGLGIVTKEDGAVVDRAGRPSEVLFAIGVLRRGAEWESTAVPELRAQADALATLLTHSGRRVAA